MHLFLIREAMSLKFVVRKITLPKDMPSPKLEKTEPTIENTIKSVLSYCNAFPNLCVIEQVPDDYTSQNELVFYFDTEKYRFFDVVSPTSLFYGVRYGDELEVNRLYYSRLLRSMITLLKAEDLLRLMNIQIEYIPSFVETTYEKVKGDKDE